MLSLRALWRGQRRRWLMLCPRASSSCNASGAAVRGESGRASNGLQAISQQIKVRWLMAHGTEIRHTSSPALRTTYSSRVHAPVPAAPSLCKLHAVSESTLPSTHPHHHYTIPHCICRGITCRGMCLVAVEISSLHQTSARCLAR